MAALTFGSWFREHMARSETPNATRPPMMLKAIGSPPGGAMKSVHRLRRVAGLSLAIPALFSSCASPRATIVPVPTITYAKRPEGRAPTLVILLPGRKSRSGDFERERFVDMARERDVDVDLIEVDLHPGYYWDGTCSRRLWEDVVAPA